MTPQLNAMIGDDTTVRLIPVIELEPCKFQREGRESPPYPVSADAWARYWSDSLADSGIVGLVPVRPGAWHVPIAQLTDPETLEKIILVHCTFNYDDEDEEIESGEPEIDPENLLAFSGGYALCLDNNVEFVPQCCGDMSDLNSWESAAAYREDYDTTVWIGHPELRVRFDGTHLLFAETGPESDLPERCAVAPDKLQAAVRQADKERRAFATLLVPVLENRIETKRAEEIADVLVGL